MFVQETIGVPKKGVREQVLNDHKGTGNRRILYTRLKKLKKLKIVKLKGQTKRFRLFAIIRVKNDSPHACIYILCNSRWETFGYIRNNLFVQTGAELLDH